MAQASVTFNLGAETVTVVLPIDLPTGGTPLSGDVSGTFGDCFVAGDLNLTGNLFIEGLMTGIDTFHVQGNGFTVFFQNGGRADLHGKIKASWGPWGTDTTGWLAGDRLAIAPTKANIYVPSELSWSNWSMARPVNSPNVTLVDGTVAKPEVVNLSQTIVIENLARGFHFHDSAGIQTLSDVKFLNCGTAGVLGNYPAHFHLLGNNSRGSVLTRVVVEGGKNHAFVPHGSHGVDFVGCAAVNTVDDAFWWDLPAQPDPHSHTANNSIDVHWDHCLALGLTGSTSATRVRLSAFMIGAGTGNRLVKSVAAAIDGGTSGTQCNGYHWPEAVNDNIGGTVWDFHHNTVHNSRAFGFFSWQNDGLIQSDHIHEMTDLIAYNCVIAGVDHGAYVNKYHWRRMVLGPAVGRSIRSHASPLSIDGDVLFEDFVSTAPFEIKKHRVNRPSFVIVRGPAPSVIVDEKLEADGNPGRYRFENTGLTPSDFTFVTVDPETVFIVTEGGVEIHRYELGVWS